MSPATRSLHLEQALTPDGWRRNVRLTLASGVVSTIETDTKAQSGDERHRFAVPGVANVHSHAFQRAMAGLAERRGPGDDNFWSWREAMYRFALPMNPEQMEAVAAQAYVEMLEAGFTRVGEFHYLHHTPEGQPYDDLAELSTRIAAAAERTQISLTLAPVFYAHSNFGGLRPNAGQRRFICDLESFARLVEGARRAIAALPGADLALAPHSLRAVTPAELAAVVAMDAQAPIHMHVAEQVGEVEACLAWSDARPVQYLLDHAPVDSRWCFIHATHMTAEETRRLAARRTVVSLCPLTEANLGDGVFNATEFFDAGGQAAVGTDSNVQIGLAPELRMMEYSQRLARRARNVLTQPGASTARALLEGAQRGGTRALGRAGAGFSVGADADVVTLRGDALDWLGADPDTVLDAWIFADAVAVDCVYAQGRLVVRDGAHFAREAIRARFRGAMRQLLAN